jgi:hypothetical protein
VYVHPRFLAVGLGRAAKPKRLALPAFAPTASNGFLPLREALEGRVEAPPLRGLALDFTAACVLLAWPFALRPPQDGEDGLLARVSGLEFPFEPLPFLAEEPVWAPLRFPLASAATLGVQRAEEADRPPLAVRESAGRESEAPRRAERPEVAACAGLRSRECATARLK